ncbi:MAG: SdiA-regulated domain-containing protein [Chlorobi bacterium]|nr:SdiA-regulated domain-containing protein [Chlorobiota bacterium]
MKRTLHRFSTLFAIAVFILCPVNPVLSDAPGLLHRYDLAGKPFRQLVLPTSLREISGVAVSRTGKLFAHDDEVSTIYQLDPSNGTVIKRFHVVTRRWFGNGRVEDDFEDIAIAGDRFFLVTSSGKLYEFREGRDNESVQAIVYKTGIGSSYEVEGLCHDPSTASLLLACKGSAGKKPFDQSASRPVYSFSLTANKLSRQARFFIDARHVAESAGKKGFRPSGITRHPLSGNFIIVSSGSRLIAEIDYRTGSLIDLQSLPSVYHPQPEGVAVLPDNSLLISSEDMLRGRAAVYRFRE